MKLKTNTMCVPLLLEAAAEVAKMSSQPSSERPWLALEHLSFSYPLDDSYKIGLLFRFGADGDTGCDKSIVAFVMGEEIHRRISEISDFCGWD
jgi:hypothetical protein